jgi:DNA-binding NtrC family response regulator
VYTHTKEISSQAGRIGPETILVADDNLEIRDYFGTVLKGQGYFVRLAEDGDEVLTYLHDNARPVSLVLLDVMMPRKGGIETYQEIRRLRGDLPVILVSGSASWPHVLEQLDEPRALCLEKPVLYDDLLRIIEQTLRREGQSVGGSSPLNSAASRHSRLLTPRSPRMRQIESLLQRVGHSDVPVLLQGETGVGKEVLARQIHAHSNKRKGPFLKLNCAALPSELVESELFGYQRGAFTGAFKDSPGKFEMAQGGTILLDEIGDMDVRLQAKLLQVLQDGEFQKLGSAETIHVDVRIMAATHCDLRKAIREGRFREDLFYRLSVIDIQVPALRERKEEILWLAEYFLRKHGVPPLQVGPRLREALLAYDWPGNVRELENTMRKYLVLREEDMIIDDVRSLIASSVQKLSSTEHSILDSAKNKAEMEVTMDALQKTQWNRAQAARLLKMDYKVFLYRMKKLGIERKNANSVEIA